MVYLGKAQERLGLEKKKMLKLQSSKAIIAFFCYCRKMQTFGIAKIYTHEDSVN